MRKYLLLIPILCCFTFLKAQTTDTAITKGKPYTATVHPATFPGGLERLYSFLAANLKYPDVAKKANVQGKVLLRFVIDTNGAVADVKVVQGLSPETNAEAVRLIKLTSNWIPGMQNGKPVKMVYSLPIAFALR